MVIDQGEDTHCFGVFVGDGFLNERRAHEAAHRFAAVGILMLFPIGVELPEQFAADRDAESNEGVFHGGDHFSLRQGLVQSSSIASRHAGTAGSASASWPALKTSGRSGAEAR